MPLFPPDSAWRPPTPIDLPADWNAYSRIALDTETRDDQLKTLGCGARRGAYLVGYSFCPEGQRPWYVPLRHAEGDNVEDPAQALEYLRYQAAHYTGEVVGAKLDYDLDMLAAAGVHFPLSRFLDVQVAEPLLDELQYSYSLDAILERHGLEKKEEDLLRNAASAYGLDPKQNLWKLPARYVGPYAEADAAKPLVLMRRQEAVIERDNLGRVWALEQKVLPILVKMRQRGVRVDADQLDRMERFSLAEESKAWGEVLRLTGVNIKTGDAMKAEVVAQALRAAGFEPPRTPKTGRPSIDKAWLEGLKSPVADMVRRTRKMSQLRSTFVASVREHLINGRIHCTFNQIKMEKEGGGDGGAAYGRLSCSDPNLQQQPARDEEIGPEWRKIYLPEEDALWASLDYSQQEPRLAVHTAIISGPQRIGATAHASALAAAQRYWDDRNTDAHTMFVQMVDGEDVIHTKGFKHRRTILKNVFLGIAYGMGSLKLCRELGFPTKIVPDKYNPGVMREAAGDEGQALLDLVDRRVPYVRATARAVERAAKAKGYVITLMGRHCHFPKNVAGEYDWTHKAFNRVIQGGAADQAKEALVQLDAAGAYLQLQIHDEFAVSVSSRAEAEPYARLLETCVELKVPSKVDLETGPSWGAVN